MNRLKSPAASPLPPQTKSARKSPADIESFIEQAVLHASTDSRSPFCLFTPLHYERNYAYPLIVWLHGPHDTEHQLHRVMPLLSMRNYAAAGPRATCMFGDDTPGFYWGTNDASFHAAEERVFDCVAAAQARMNIAPQRIFIAGYQCGGSMALRIALNHPEFFAGALSLGGPFPLGRQPLANLSRIRRLPLFLTHGRESADYPVDRVCDELRLFHSAGMNVTLRQYPGEDELTTKMLHDVDVWVMERVTGQSMSTSEKPAAEIN